MAKDRLCTDCIYNNNGWCKARKTNKGLRDLLECEFKKSDRIDPVKEESLKKLMIMLSEKEDKFWDNFYDDESMANDLLDDAMKIMNLQKVVITNLMTKVKILESK